MKNNTTSLTHTIQLKDRSGRVVAEKEVISYAGLLDLAHRDRLDSVDTTIIQLPTNENGFTTIVRAVVRTSRGTYTAIGDASPSTVAPQIAPHATRMAETRALARAFRTAVNIGVVAIEELAGETDVIPEMPRVAVNADAPTKAPPANDARQTQTSATEATQNRSRSDSSRASDEQRRYLYRLLQGKNIEGDAARAFIKKELGVAAVKDAPKAAVSALIDRLKNGSGEHPTARRAVGG